VLDRIGFRLDFAFASARGEATIMISRLFRKQRMFRAANRQETQAGHGDAPSAI